MAAVLTFCGREWRAQRGLLVAYTLVALGSLCLVLLLVPDEWWREEGQGALALSWFVAVGTAGVLAFAAPNLVRSEYGPKGDQFVRRLPGALWPSFLGKLLFLALVAAALPLLCLLAGQGFLLAIGQSWGDLFQWIYSGEVLWRVPEWTSALGYAALLLPWVWAIGTWLPKGRMAVGGTIVFVLLLALGVFAVLRQCPQIELGIAWWNWLWLVPGLGVVVAAVSWICGRRGGGALRSARCGLMATAVGLMPPSLWFADRVVDYHRPDLQRLVELSVSGCSPDGRYVLAHGSANSAFMKVPMRIDLRDGSAVQLGGIHTWVAPSWQRPWGPDGGPSRRWWPLVNWWDAGEVGQRRALDLETLAEVQVPWSEARNVPLDPRALTRLLGDERRTTTNLRAPGNRAVWWEGAELCFEVDGGAVERMPWPGELPGAVCAVGHGLRAFGERMQWFDFATRRVIAAAPATTSTMFVRGAIVFRRQHELRSPSTWWRRLQGGEDERIDGLDGCCVLGLVDDDRLLCVRGCAGGSAPRLCLWHVHANTITDISVPARLQGSHWTVVQAGGYGSLLAREPGGRICLRAGPPFATNEEVSLVLLDVDAARLDTVCAWRSPQWSPPQAVHWQGPGCVVLVEGASLVRLDLATGAREPLFPRRP